MIGRLTLFSVSIVMATAVLLFFSRDTGTSADKAAHIFAVLHTSLWHGSWQWVGKTTVALALLAGVLSALELALRKTQRSGGRSFDPLGSGNIRDRVLEVERRVKSLLTGERGDVVQAFEELVRGAIAVEASDIHMSPSADGFRLTYRVHGTLYPIALLDRIHAPRIATRVKVLARLDTYVHGAPQDGRLVMTVDGVIVEARVSTLPTESGERVVLRFVRGSRKIPELDTLGFSPQVLAGLESVLQRPQGLLFLAAPVGSGKTTTLYAAMKHIAATRGSTTTLVTLEDPVELELPFATQTQMHPRSGMTFASTLRSVLRQDPNVLMLGEIRDAETADIAMQAGLTGHLILTTVHGDGAAGPFARMIDMGIEPFVLASATIGCLSQRLVRTLCTACRREAPVEPVYVERLRQLNVTLPDGQFYEPVGCDYCEGTGFTGRVPIAELLLVDSELRSAINGRAPTAELDRLARAAGMVPLVVDGLERAARGETSIAEVVRVAG